MKKNSILACISILLLIGLDQIVKFLITSHMALYDTIPVIKQVFHITYIQNKGAAWGSLQGKALFSTGNNHSCSGISCIFLCSDVKAE